MQSLHILLFISLNKLFGQTVELWRHRYVIYFCFGTENQTNRQRTAEPRHQTHVYPFPWHRDLYCIWIPAMTSKPLGSKVVVVVIRKIAFNHVASQTLYYEHTSIMETSLMMSFFYGDVSIYRSSCNRNIKHGCENRSLLHHSPNGLSVSF